MWDTANLWAQGLTKVVDRKLVKQSCGGENRLWVLITLGGHWGQRCLGGARGRWYPLERPKGPYGQDMRKTANM